MNNLQEKEFQTVVVRKLTELGKRTELSIHWQFQQVWLEKSKKNIKSELKNTIIKTKKLLEGINIRLDDREKCISDLKGRIIDIIQSKQPKEKQI